MSEREEQAGGQRLLAVLHELAGDVVDGRDVVGIDRVPQAEAIGQEARAEQHRMIMEYDESAGPDDHIGGDQEGTDGDDLARQAWMVRACIVVAGRPQKGARHGTSMIEGPLAEPQYDVLTSNIIHG